MPILQGHLVPGGIAGDPGVVDQHVDRAQIGDDLPDAGLAGRKIRHVPFIDRDAGLLLELGRGLVIADIVGRNAVAGFLERLCTQGANAAGSTRHQCDARHSMSPPDCWLPSLTSDRWDKGSP